MISITTKNRILTLHQEGMKGYEGVKHEEYRQLYYSILPSLSSKNPEWRSAVSDFLIQGTMAFDRFVNQRPHFVDEERYNMYCKFLSTLQKFDGQHTERTFFFHLEKIKWEIFRECSLLPYDVKTEFLDNCETNINALAIPQVDGHVIENLKAKKNELLLLINNIRSGQVKTFIHTTLPIKLTGTDATININVEGVDVIIKLTYQSHGSTLPGTSISEGSTMTTSGPSRWTTTSCEIDIEIDCLMDGLDKRSCVTFQKKEDKRYWTEAFDFTYKVLLELWIHIQQNEDTSGVWPPLPNDIHYLKYSVQTTGNEIDGELTTNPALVYTVSSLKKEPQSYEIEGGTPNWSVYSYQFAKVYAESGQLKESIFWLNVSVEALVEEFIHKIAKTEDELKEFEAEESNFAKAEEELTKQFPDMKGKVQWPNSTHHASVFTKLKRAVNKSPLATRQKDILKNYSRVNAKRNDLFHGNSVEISVEDVEKAFNAYQWLKENLI